MRQMTLLLNRGRTRWRRGEDCRNVVIRQQVEGNETCGERSFLLEGALFWNSKRGSSDGNPTRRAVRKGLKDKLDD